LAPHSEAAFDSNKPPVVAAFLGAAEMVAVAPEVQAVAEGHGSAEAQVVVRANEVRPTFSIFFSYSYSDTSHHRQWFL
jgi:hypothetical protein